MRGCAIIFMFLFNFVIHCSGHSNKYSSGIQLGNTVVGEEDGIRRCDFPDDFVFGTATSAYQIEGGYVEDGKSLSNWDVFTRIPGWLAGGIENGDNGDIADDHYHRFMEDIEIVESLGTNAYRFSISWSRILPGGIHGDVNNKAVEFYNKIIDNLILRGIKPFVTLHHFELPHQLEDDYGGWLNPIIQEEFVGFAGTCFHHFGDRVKQWATMNEPALYSELGYLKGIYPPSHCSPPYGNCSTGNSDQEPLIVVHNMILAHSKATLLYRTHYQPTQAGSIGIVASVFMYQPYNAERDKQAVERALAFQVGWVLDPLLLVYGQYPEEMRRLIGESSMPRFSEDEIEVLRKARGVDFIGVNQYTTLYVKDCLKTDQCVDQGNNRAIKGFVEITGEGQDGLPIGETTAMPKFFVVPDGMEKTIDYISGRYPSIPIYVTENGYAEGESGTHILNDHARVDYHKKYLGAVARAMRKGADVKGYFVWSLMDNFEWCHGYSIKFGLYSVNRTTLQRVPKLSAAWYSRFLQHQHGDHEMHALS